MPSVGMRRTRVFGVVKGVDGARVLRSGRRLWPESGEVKLKKSKDAGDWFRVIDDRRSGGGSGQDRLDCKWPQVRNVNPKRVIVADIHEEDDNCVVEVPKPIKASARTGGDGEFGVVDRMFGKVYGRKRKRHPSDNGDVSDDMEEDNVSLGDRMFGLRFIRRQRARKTDDECWEPTSAGYSNVYFSGQSISSHRDSVLTIFAENRSDSECFSNFTLSVLRHLRSAVLRVTELSAFLLSDPIHGVFASNGVHFLQDYPSTGSSGICVIFGAMQSTPIFFLDFSAIPFFFMYLHSRMFLRATRTQPRLVNNSINKDEDVNISSDSEEDSTEERHVPSPSERSLSGCETMAFGVDHPKSRPIVHRSVRASRSAGRNMQYRNGVSSRGIRKRRSSLRMRRPRNPSLAAVQKTISSVASESLDDVKHCVSFSSVASYSKHNSAQSDSAGHLREVSLNALGSAMDIDSLCCTANILIVESDRCLREGGANIVLELSASCEWLLVVKKDGLTRYTHKSERVMRPSSVNRFTHAIIWSGDNSWKLEFPNRRDWLIFKDLYKECSDHNVSGSTAKTIPVPGVYEVPGYVDSSIASFHRPDSYISLNDDEVCRALARTTANYDVDSDDEEWLNKFNNELIAKNEHHECISGDNFELMIDALEKGFYCNPDAFSFSNEKAPADLCMHLGSRQIIESVFTYWMKKRRQKRSSLVRVFQAHQAKRKPPVVPKPVMRRRRSLKRKPSQSGRAKQPNILQAIVSRQDALEDQNILLKFQEAKASANKSIESAVWKRQRAQLLLENADLAAYKAMMALRIAEAIQLSKMPEAAASNFLE